METNEEKKNNKTKFQPKNNNCLLDFSFFIFMTRYAHIIHKVDYTSNLLQFSWALFLFCSKHNNNDDNEDDDDESSDDDRSGQNVLRFHRFRFESNGIEMNYINGKTYKSICGRDDDICVPVYHGRLQSY